MKEATRVIERILEARFGKMEAQALVFGRARLVGKDIQFTDVKHMSDLIERYRILTRAAIAAYRDWQSVHDVETDPIARLYSAAEGAGLHRRISDHLRLWYFAHRDYHEMRRMFLFKCMAPQIKVNWENAA